MTDQPISLEEIRLRLNELDDELLSLLSERRKLSIEVAKSKVQTSKPVRDAVREQQLLVKLITNGRDKYELDAQYITKLSTPLLKILSFFNKATCKTSLIHFKAVNLLLVLLSLVPRALIHTLLAANTSAARTQS